MKNMKTFKCIALLLAVVMAFALTGCETTSSSTVTTSVTDENGITTTNTTTTVTDEDGITTTDTTTTVTDEDGNPITDAAEAEVSEDDWDDAIERMYSLYDIGAEGVNEAGDKFYYAFNEGGSDAAALVIVTADGMNYWGREGTAEFVDDHVVLHSNSMGDDTPYVFSEVDDNNCFTITFLGDGDVAQMQLVDQDTIIADIIACMQQFR